jgi:hypothetical protein
MILSITTTIARSEIFPYGLACQPDLTVDAAPDQRAEIRR